MGLQQLIEHERNQPEPLLNEIKEFFKDRDATVSLIQRHFKFGYRRAIRAMHQLEVH